MAYYTTAEISLLKKTSLFMDLLTKIHTATKIIMMYDTVKSDYLTE